MRDLGGHTCFAEEPLLIGFKILKLWLQCLHDDRTAQILVHARSENGFPALAIRN